MPPSGDATPDVLAALKTDSIGPSTVPAEKPREDVTSKASAEDPGRRRHPQRRKAGSRPRPPARSRSHHLSLPMSIWC